MLHTIQGRRRTLLAHQFTEAASQVLVGLLPGGYLHAEISLGEGDEVLDLGVVQEAAVVLVGLSQCAAAPPGGEPPAAAAEGLPELVPADPAVAVGVELLQPLLELLQRHVLARGGHAPDRHGCRSSTCLLAVLAGVQQVDLSTPPFIVAHRPPGFCRAADLFA